MFENLTMAPIDKDLINYNLLNSKEKIIYQISFKYLLKNFKYLNAKKRNGYFVTFNKFELFWVKIITLRALLNLFF